MDGLRSMIFALAGSALVSESVKMKAIDLTKDLRAQAWDLGGGHAGLIFGRVELSSAGGGLDWEWMVVDVSVDVLDE